VFSRLWTALKRYRREARPVNTARKHGYRLDTHVLGAVLASWQKALSCNTFCQHGPLTRVIGIHYPCSRAV